MVLNDIERDFKNKVSEKLSLSSEGVDRYRVFTPFMFEDGDHLSIVLKRMNGGWILSDEGHTYMHLTYDLEEKDLQKGTRQKIITNALSMLDSYIISASHMTISARNTTTGHGTGESLPMRISSSWSAAKSTTI